MDWQGQIQRLFGQFNFLLKLLICFASSTTAMISYNGKILVFVILEPQKMI